MNCPNCGDPRAEYEDSRKKYWSGHRKGGRDTEAPKPRTNFKAKCKKCGYEWDDTPPDYVPTPEQPKEEVDEDEILGQEDMETDLTSEE